MKLLERMRTLQDIYRKEQVISPATRNLNQAKFQSICEPNVPPVTHNAQPNRVTSRPLYLVTKVITPRIFLESSNPI
jgi:hypothetical protein